MANSNGWGDGAANNSIGWGQGANNAISWGDSHAKSWAGATDIVGITTDPAASAYFASTGITGATQQTAIDNLVKGLKSDGLWSKMKAVYPFVTDNRNLISYSEDFSNAYWAKNNSTITVNSTIAPNGTLTADTLTDNATNNFHGISTFQTAFGQNGNNTLSIYAKANSLNYLILYFYNGSEPSGKSAWFNLSNGTIGTVQSGITASIENAGNGWYRCSITRNFNFTATFSNCGYGVANNDNVVTYIGSNQSIYIWGAQVDAAATATTYQPIATTQQAFISNQFKYNLVNPVDSDAAFRLVFNGGWTHSANGATPNGTNGYADTKFNTDTNQSVNNCSISVYLRTASMGSGFITDMGNYGSGFLPITNIESNATIRYQYAWDFTNAVGIITTTDSKGMWGTSRSGTSSWISFERNTAVAKTVTTSQTYLPNNNVYLGATNGNGSANAFSFREIAFAHLGDSLTSTQYNNLYTRVQAFQTALSRQV